MTVLLLAAVSLLVLFPLSSTISIHVVEGGTPLAPPSSSYSSCDIAWSGLSLRSLRPTVGRGDAELLVDTPAMRTVLTQGATPRFQFSVGRWTNLVGSSVSIGDSRWWHEVSAPQFQWEVEQAVGSPAYRLQAVVYPTPNGTRSLTSTAIIVADLTNGIGTLNVPFAKDGLFEIDFSVIDGSGSRAGHLLQNVTMGFNVLPSSEPSVVTFLKFGAESGLHINDTLCATIRRPLPPLTIHAVGSDLKPIKTKSENASLLIEAIDFRTGTTLTGVLSFQGPIEGEIGGGGSTTTTSGGDTLTFHVQNLILLREVEDIVLHFTLNGTESSDWKLSPRLLLRLALFRSPTAACSLQFDPDQTYPRLGPQSAAPLTLTSGVIIPELRVNVLDSAHVLDVRTTQIIAQLDLLGCDGGYISTPSQAVASVIDGTATFQGVVLQLWSTATGHEETCILRVQLSGQRSLPLHSRPIFLSNTYYAKADIAFVSAGLIRDSAVVDSRTGILPKIELFVLDSVLNVVNPSTVGASYSVNASHVPVIAAPSFSATTRVATFSNILFHRESRSSWIRAHPVTMSSSVSSSAASYLLQSTSMLSVTTDSSRGHVISASVPVRHVSTSHPNEAVRLAFVRSNPSLSHQMQDNFITHVGVPLPVITILLLDVDGNVDRANNETRVTVESGSSLFHTLGYSSQGHVQFSSLMFSDATVGAARLTFTAGSEGGRQVAGYTLKSGVITLLNLGQHIPTTASTPTTSTAATAAAVFGTDQKFRVTNVRLVPEDVVVDALLEIRDRSDRVMRSLFVDPSAQPSLPTLRLILTSVVGERIRPPSAAGTTKYRVDLTVNKIVSSGSNQIAVDGNGVAEFNTLQLKNNFKAPISSISFCLYNTYPVDAVLACVSLRIVLSWLSSLPAAATLNPIPSVVVANQSLNLSYELRRYGAGAQLLTATGGSVAVASAISFSNATTSEFTSGAGSFNQLRFHRPDDVLVDGVSAVTITATAGTVLDISDVSAPFYVQPAPPVPEVYPLLVIELFDRLWTFGLEDWLRSLADHLHADPARFRVSRVSEGLAGQWSGVRIELQITPPWSTSPLKQPTSQLIDQVLSLQPTCETSKINFYRAARRLDDTSCDHFYLLDRVEGARHCEAFHGRNERCTCFIPLFEEIGSACAQDPTMLKVCSHLSHCGDNRITSLCESVSISIELQVVIVVSGCIGVILLGLAVLYLRSRKDRITRGRPSLSSKKALIRCKEKRGANEVLLM